jgi:hypothetical protein
MLLHRVTGSAGAYYTGRAADVMSEKSLQKL